MAETSNPLLSAEIKALPDHVRQYIHDLETNADPAGDKWRILALEQNVAGLTHDNERLRAENERRRAALEEICRCNYQATDFPSPAMIAGRALTGAAVETTERICEWTPIEDGSPVYTPSCPDGEEWQLEEGCELYPFCHWCGGRIVVRALEDEPAEKADDPLAQFRWICPSCTTVNDIKQHHTSCPVCATLRPKNGSDEHG